MSRPRTRWWTLLAVLILVTTQLGAIAVAGQDQGDDSGEEGEDRPDGQDNPGESNETAENETAGSDSSSGDGSDDYDSEDRDDRSDGAEDRRRGPPAGVGRVQERDGSFSGRFVQVEATGQGLANLSYDGRLLFSHLAVDGLTVEEVESRGARIEVEGKTAGEDVRFRLHDTPTATMRIDIDDDVELEIVLADNVTPSMDGPRRVNLIASGVQAVLWSDKTPLDVNGSTIEVTGETRLSFMVARGPTTSDDASAFGSAVARAASEGRVGAEVRAVAEGGDVRSEVVEFGDMSVMATHGNESFLVVVSSDNETGRTVVMHLDPAVLGGNGSRELEVRFDGRPIEQAEDLQDVLDPSNDGDRAEYVLVHGSDGIQALVSVPSFSTHTIEVAALPGVEVITQLGLSPAQVATALAAAGATVLVAALVAGKRR